MKDYSSVNLHKYIIASSTSFLLVHIPNSPTVQLARPTGTPYPLGKIRLGKERNAARKHEARSSYTG